MSITATLTGNRRVPELRVRLPWGARMANGADAQTWMKKRVPGRYWDASAKCWVITGTGTHPDRFFAEHGVEVDYSQADGDLAGLDSLSSLYMPLVKRSTRFPHTAFVRPRLVGFEKVSERLGPGAVWDKKLARFEVQLADLVENGAAKRGIDLDADTLAAALATQAPRPLPAHVQDAARELAASTAVEKGGDQKVPSARTLELIETVAEHTGRLPDWFGLDLFPFQLAGAYGVAAGHRLLADSPGCGKTRGALAAAAIVRAERIVIVVPPLVVTNWAREADAALGPFFAAGHPVSTPPASGTGRKGRAKRKVKAPEFPEYVVPIRAGRKVPPFPDRGIVIVADSLIASRPALLDEIIAWAPDAALFDEVHRARTFDGVRATAARNLACSVGDGLRIAITGTPILQSPVEVTNALAIAGMLDAEWGGPSAFIERYATKNRFGAWLPRRKMLPELQQRLSKSAWVRRNKADVLTQLPPKLRTYRMVDIDPRGFRAAHDALWEKVEEWLDEHLAEHGRVTEADIEEFAKSRIELITPLRAAAGVAKVPAAIEIITDWLASSTEIGQDGAKIYTRPLIVWVHHRPVMEALRAAIPEDLAGIDVIDGSTPDHRRQAVADRLQNGEIGAIICSIGAAGFGLTLTRSSDVLFVETDWTPANVSQAEDRAHRVGQTETVMVTTLIAPETLDPHMRAILRNKAKDLNVLMPGADNNVTDITAVLNEAEGVYEQVTVEERELERDFKSIADIVARIVTDVVESRSTSRRRAA
ncbi:DEAD/DEAH box helicase [Tersicoccus sp. MR15.9]|uniref:DEAD/DEAH box helicase n=1 Tax=Tersicoccus mangrovi TaxID=3121635 RepID=UPI002FE64F57